MNNDHKLPSSYRWVILAVVWLTIFSVDYSQMQLAPLAYKVIPDLHLTRSQFSMVLLAPFMTAILFSFLGGALADKFGVKKIVGIGFVISTAAFYFRYAANDFWQMFILMFLGGMTATLLNANVSKLIGYWFPNHQIGTALGVYFSGVYAGVCAANATAALLFSDFKTAFTASGIMVFVVLVLWWVLIKNKPEGAADIEIMPVTKYMGEAAKSKGVWLVGIAAALWMASDMSYQAFMPVALHESRGISPQYAGLMVSFITLGALVGALIGPALLRHLGGRVKMYIAPMAVVIAVIMYITWVVDSVVVAWILFAIGGLLTGTIPPLLFEYPVLLPEIGPKYAGSAGGIVATLQEIGAFVVPSFIVAPLLGHSYTLLFLTSAILFMLIGVVALFFPKVETSPESAVSNTEIKL
jgi:NNP family nitrate/nitrite transporter-like MFS transporter